MKLNKLSLVMPLLALVGCGDGSVDMSVEFEPRDTANGKGTGCTVTLAVENNGPELVESASIGTGIANAIIVKNIQPGQRKTSAGLVWTECESIPSYRWIRDYSCRMSNSNCKPIVTLGEGMRVEE